jgi:hypothetical protein
MPRMRRLKSAISWNGAARNAWANYAANAPTEKRHLLERRSEKRLSADTT